MNDVPVLFYERLVPQIYIEAISASCELSGVISEVAADQLENAAMLVVGLVDGEFVDDHFFSYLKLQNEQIPQVSRKHHWHTMVIVRADGDEYLTQTGALQKLSAAVKHKRVSFDLDTSNINDDIEKWIGSMPFCYRLTIRVYVPKIVNMLIQKRTLYRIFFKEQHKIPDEAIDQLLQLLQQEQFYSAAIFGISELGLQKLISGWQEHSVAMVGKTLLLGKLELELTAHGFRNCNEEDERYFKFYHPRFNLLRVQSSALILKSERGDAAIYCLIPDDSSETLIVFV